METEKELAKIPNVCAVYDITGQTDAMVIAKFKSRRSLSDFTKRLLAMPFIERTNTHMVLTTVKEDFRMKAVLQEKRRIEKYIEKREMELDLLAFRLPHHH